MPNGFFYINFLDKSISIRWGIWLVFIETPVFNANSVDPDQMLQHLIWVYTVCKCPIYGKLGINGLIFFIPLQKHILFLYTRSA